MGRRRSLHSVGWVMLDTNLSQLVLDIPLIQCLSPLAVPCQTCHFSEALSVCVAVFCYWVSASVV